MDAHMDAPDALMAEVLAAEMRSKPKLKGVSRQGGRYVATINLDGEDQDLGRFASEFEGRWTPLELPP